MEIKPITYPNQIYTSQGALAVESTVKRAPVPITYPKPTSSIIDPISKTLGIYLDVRA